MWEQEHPSDDEERHRDFLAVDEIQLAAHRERGHVFSDRLLHARGERETMFLGADTMPTSRVRSTDRR